jgi:hypothetical protein
VVPVGIADGLCAVVEPGFGEQVVDVGLDGGFGDVERVAIWALVRPSAIRVSTSAGQNSSQTSQRSTPTIFAAITQPSP